MKICSKCKISKVESEFYKCDRVRCGLTAQCKQCGCERFKIYEIKNREERRVKFKEYRKQYFKNYYHNNKEKIAAIIKKSNTKNYNRRLANIYGWRRNNKNKWREMQKRNSQDNREKLGDRYLKKLAVDKRKFNPSHIKQYPEILEVIKIIVKTKRLCKSQILNNSETA